MVTVGARGSCGVGPVDGLAQCCKGATQVDHLLGS